MSSSTMNMVLYYLYSSTRNVWLIALGLDPLFPLLSGCFRRMGVREVTCYNAFSMIASRSCLLAAAKDSAADDGWMERWWRSLQDNYQVVWSSSVIAPTPRAPPVLEPSASAVSLEGLQL